MTDFEKLIQLLNEFQKHGNLDYWDDTENQMDKTFKSIRIKQSVSNICDFIFDNNGKFDSIEI